MVAYATNLLSMKTKAYKLEESLGYVMGRAARSLGTRLNRNFTQDGYDVTCEQWGVLVNLSHNNGQTQKELAGVSCKDKTSITRLIDGMEKRDLVVRIPDKKDGRQKLIYLTNKGKELQRKLLYLVKKTLEEGQSGIPATNLRICKDVLRRVAKNLT